MKEGLLENIDVFFEALVQSPLRGLWDLKLRLHWTQWGEIIYMTWKLIRAKVDIVEVQWPIVTTNSTHIWQYFVPEVSCDAFYARTFRVSKKLAFL